MQLVKISATLSLALGLGLGVAQLAAEGAAAKPAKAEKGAKGAAKAAAPDPAAEALMKKSDCFTCHNVAKKVVGPSYKDVAKKYKGDAKAEDMLVEKVIKGGSGHWGQVPMAGHPNLKPEDARAMVRWVLAQK